jgi:hypothetical protein
MILKNDSKAIKEHLEKSIEEVYSIKHIGNFVFEATTSAGTVRIITEPVNEKEIKVLIIK